jgi:hypothetical protein
MTNRGNSGFAAVRQLRRTKTICTTGFALGLALCIAAVPLFSAPTTTVAEGNYGKAPIAFEPNVGQSDPQVKFVARADGYTLFLTPAETVFLLKSAAQGDKSSADANAERGSALRLGFLHANEAAPMQASDQLLGKVNYFRGNDPKTWHTEIPTFAKVAQRDVYSGIDVVY